MKARVTEIFQDKFTKKHYAIGTIIDIDNADRIEILKDKGLVEVIEDTEIKPITPKRRKNNDRSGESGSK